MGVSGAGKGWRGCRRWPGGGAEHGAGAGGLRGRLGAGERGGVSSRCVSVGACVTVFWRERGKWLTTLHSFCPACPGPCRRMGCAQPAAAVPGRRGGARPAGRLAFCGIPPGIAGETGEGESPGAPGTGSPSVWFPLILLSLHTKRHY